MQVSLIEHDNVVQTLAADRAHQPFDVRRLPGRARGDPDFLQTQSLGAALEERAVNAVTVAQQVLRGRREREGFPELLSRPSRRRGRYDIEVQNAAAMMRQDNKDVQEVKVEGGDDQEVDRHHAAEVIAEESRPVLGWGPADMRDHVLGDGALGNGQAKLKEFTVDAGSPPERIGATHLADQADGVWGDGLPAGFVRTAFPSPEEPKARAMPLKDGAGLNQAQPTLPSAPGLREPGPKDPVQRRQTWSLGAPAQHEQLVSQGQHLEEHAPAGFQSGNGQVKREGQPMNHAAEDSGKYRRSPVFSPQMRFLPVTGDAGGPIFIPEKMDR